MTDLSGGSAVPVSVRYTVAYDTIWPHSSAIALRDRSAHSRRSLSIATRSAAHRACSGAGRMSSPAASLTTGRGRLAGALADMPDTMTGAMLATPVHAGSVDGTESG